MRIVFAGALVALSVAPSLAAAATCEESFVKKGLNFVTSQSFKAEVMVADVTPVNAIRQVRGIITAKSYDVIADDAESGQLLFEQSIVSGRTSVPFTVSATEDAGQTTIKMAVKLKVGMITDAEDLKKEVCLILNGVKGGEEGIAAAERGKDAKTVDSGVAFKRSAMDLAKQIHDEAVGNTAMIQARYPGKLFAISGSVVDISKSKSDDTYLVSFMTSDGRNLSDPLRYTSLTCQMAKGQSGVALSLKAGDYTTLTGRFDEYSTRAGFEFISLADCKKPIE